MDKQQLYDFDRVIDRSGTASLKYDGRKNYFGKEDVLPLWVADMDFASPEAVTQALVARAAHPVYGYSVVPDSLYASLCDWFLQRHGWRIELDWILLTPGVVPSLNATVLALTNPGDGVIVQSPVYFPFFSAISGNSRRIVHNPLKHIDGRYVIDYEHLESCATEARMIILCSPHNPVGRVWQLDELKRLQEIAARHQLTILSDEIHADLVYPGHRHIPLASMADASVSVITAISPSKTFNIPGLGLSALVVPDATQRARIRDVFDTLHVSANNPFNMAAFEAAYRHGAPWLDALLAYLDVTRQMVGNYLAENIPQIRLIQPEGTYLIWLDCRDMGLGDADLQKFLLEEAKVGLSPGKAFGAEPGFMRINIGAPRATVMECLERIRQAIDRTSP